MSAAHADDDDERAEALLDQFEADPDAFEIDNGGEEHPSSEGAIRLRAAISVRFDTDTTARLRAAATDLEMGYTSLVRRFVMEGLDRMEGLPTPTAVHRRVLLDVEVTPAGDVNVSTSRVA